MSYFLKIAIIPVGSSKVLAGTKTHLLAALCATPYIPAVTDDPRTCPSASRIGTPFVISEDLVRAMLLTFAAAVARRGINTPKRFKAGGPRSYNLPKPYAIVHAELTANE